MWTTYSLAYKRYVSPKCKMERWTTPLERLSVRPIGDMALIDIGNRSYLLYRVLSHPTTMALLSEDSRSRLDAINRLVHDTAYSDDGAASYDQIHQSF